MVRVRWGASLLLRLIPRVGKLPFLLCTRLPGRYHANNFQSLTQSLPKTTQLRSNPCRSRDEICSIRGIIPVREVSRGDGEGTRGATNAIAIGTVLLQLRRRYIGNRLAILWVAEDNSCENMTV